jgi:hypothetical protein
MKWTGHVERRRQEKNVQNLLVRKPEGKTSLGRPRLSWVDNIKMDQIEIEWDGVAQDKDK